MKRKFLIGLVSIILLGAAGFFGATSIQKTIMINDDGQIQTVSFWGFRVQVAIATAGIAITAGDEVIPPRNSRIRENESIEIHRAFWVIITADGESQTLWTRENIPANLADQAGLTLRPNDLVEYNGKAVEIQKPLPKAPVQNLQIHRATEIILTTRGKQEIFWSAAPTLGEALWDAGIIIFAADHLQPSAQTPLSGGLIQAELIPSREIRIQTRDEIIQTRVLASTVGEALAKANMPLQGLDYSIPAEMEPLPEDGNIRIVKVSEEVVLEQSPISFGQQFVASAEIDLDTQQVLQVGEYGITAQRFRVVYEDGEEVSRSVEDEWLAKNPQDRIVGYGTKIKLQTAQTPNGPIEYWRKVDVFATSYSPCNIGVPGKCGTHTASGKVPQKGMIAVIRSWYNQMQGQPVYVTSYGYATIEDIGAGIAGQNWIDLAFTDEAYSGWSGHVTLYFLTPVPANVMWILE